jgi:hypothetical protein
MTADPRIGVALVEDDDSTDAADRVATREDGVSEIRDLTVRLVRRVGCCATATDLLRDDDDLLRDAILWLVRARVERVERVARLLVERLVEATRLSVGGSATVLGV